MLHSHAVRLAAFLGLAPLAACARGDDAASRDTPSIDSLQLFAHLEFLSADSLEGRFVGSRGNRIAREYIQNTFEQLGLLPFGGSFTETFPVERDDRQMQGANVVAHVRGVEEPDQFLVLTAHYDHLGVRDGEVYNGADDNGSGTAALLALASHFSEHRPRHSIVFAAVDAEEGGLSGARAFVSAPPVPLDAILANLNMDMVSHSDGELYVAGTYHYPVLKQYVERIRESAAVTLRFGHDSPELGSGDWTNSSDHGPFHEAGIPFLYFGVEDHPDYHQPTDDFDTINRIFYPRAIDAILRILIELDRDLEPVAAVRREGALAVDP